MSEEWLGLPFPPWFHISDKGMVVLSNDCCERVLWSQLLLIDGQGPPVERFSLLVLALLTVEFCQVIEACCCGRVPWSQLLLPDKQSTLVKRLRLGILALLP